jgi:hypothetical protein
MFAALPHEMKPNELLGQNQVCGQWTIISVLIGLRLWNNDYLHLRAATPTIQDRESLEIQIVSGVMRVK